MHKKLSRNGIHYYFLIKNIGSNSKGLFWTFRDNVSPDKNGKSIITKYLRRKMACVQPLRTKFGRSQECMILRLVASRESGSGRSREFTGDDSFDPNFGLSNTCTLQPTTSILQQRTSEIRISSELNG